MKNSRIMNAFLAVLIILSIMSASVAGAAVYYSTLPQVKIAQAVKKSVFEAESFSFTADLPDSELKFAGKVVYGKDINDTKAVLTLGGEPLIGVYNGKMFFNYNGYGFVGTFDEFEEYWSDLGGLLETMGLSFSEPDITTVFEVVSEIVKDNRLNRSAIEKGFNKILLPVACNLLDIESANVPDFNGSEQLLFDFLENGLSEEAVLIERDAKSGSVQYYEMKVDGAEVAQCVFDYAEENEEFNGILNSSLLSEIDAGDFDSLGEYEVVFGIENGMIISVEIDGYEFSYSDYNETDFDDEKISGIMEGLKDSSIFDALKSIIEFASNI